MILLEDVFRVEKLDPDGKKFDKAVLGSTGTVEGFSIFCHSDTEVVLLVTRIEARSERFDMFMHLDVNTEIYPMVEGQKFTMALATTLNLDGTPDTGYYTPGGRKSIADKYEYIMHGKLYKISEEDPAKAAAKGHAAKAEIYVSYGGLLMLLKGDPSNLHKFDLDQRLFLCIRKL